MKTYTEATLPTNALYLGTENGDGSMYEDLRDAIDFALEPARVRHPDGTYSYFELAD